MSCAARIAGALVAGALAAPGAARAAFAAPQRLLTARGPLIAFAAAGDAAGAITVVAAGDGLAPSLIARAPGGAWGGPVAGPGSSDLTAAAAGDGALAIAWRIDTPRRYSGIAVAVRDPGGELSQPIELAGADAGGVRHPAVAIDDRGDVVAAWNTGTRASSLSHLGRLAVAYRHAGRRFSTPVVVERAMAGPPAVAIGRDGRALVTWLAGRRVSAVDIDARGARAVKRIAHSRAPDAQPRVAVGPAGSGVITFSQRIGPPFPPHPGESLAGDTLQVALRPRGGVFGPARALRGAHPTCQVALAADEQGHFTIAWPEARWVAGRGIAGHPEARVLTAAARDGGRFARPRVLGNRSDSIVSDPQLAARGARVAIAWAAQKRGALRIEAASGPAGRITPPQALAVTPSSDGTVYPPPGGVSVTLSRRAHATVLWVDTHYPPPGQPTASPDPAAFPPSYLVAADGP